MRIVDCKRDKRDECPGPGTNWGRTLYANSVHVNALINGKCIHIMQSCVLLIIYFACEKFAGRYEVSKDKGSCGEYALRIRLKISHHKSRISIRFTLCI